MILIPRYASAIPMHRAPRKGSRALLFQGIIFAVLGATLSYLGNVPSSAPFNTEELIGPALFWYAIAMLLLAFPFHEAATTCYRGLRTRLGAAVFWPYLLVHLMVYGFLVEVILGSMYGFTSALSPSITVSTDAFMPASFISTLLDLVYNPSVAFTLPPVLSGELTFYAISIAVLVDVLLLANVLDTVELGRLCTLGRKARTYFLLPLVGLVLGASCCLSVPALISIAAPSATNNALFIWTYSATYYFFPPFAIVVLYLNLFSIDRITSNIRTSSTAGIP